MTVDYPDYQAFASSMGANLFAGAQQVLAPGAHNTAVVPVTSYQSLSVIVAPTTGAGNLVVSHWVDPAGTISASMDTFRFRVGTALVLRMPLRAPYVQLTLNVTSVANLTATTWATPLASSSDRISFPVGGQQAGDPTQILAAGVVAEWRVPAICAGPAMLMMRPGDTSGKITFAVNAADEKDNILYPIMQAVAPTVLTMQPLQLPGQITEIFVTNTDTVNPHEYGVSLICPPQ